MRRSLEPQKSLWASHHTGMTNTTMLTYTDAVGNNNKFYEITVSGDAVEVRYGRINTNGQRKTYSGGQRKADQLEAAKLRKGYVEFRGAAAPRERVATDLRAASRAGLVAKGVKADDPRVSDLIDYLVAQNRHQIIETSGGSIKVTDGQVSTPLGLLSEDAIREARIILGSMQSQGATRPVSLLENYLRLVPQEVPRQRGWHEDFLTSQREYDKQSLFLDQLEASVQFAAAQNSAVDNGDKPSLSFRYQLAPVDDAKIIASMQHEYDKTSNQAHRGVVGAKVKAVYALTDTASDDAFDAKVSSIGNVRQMWHGTRAFNVLSIAAKGFLLPTATAGLVTAGAMFGHGIYASEQSTKSANYSRGGMWSSGVDHRWFMLRCDVAMGREFWPNRHASMRGANSWSHSYSTLGDQVLSGRLKDDEGKGFDSINVKAGTCGVLNHEAIVGNLDQLKPRYLIEFSG